MIIEDAKNGIPFILVGAHENKGVGVIIIPAQFATAAQINFMTRFARGMVRLSLTEARVTELALPLGTGSARQRSGLAPATSIDAKEGGMAGISAEGRAHTIAVAIDSEKSAKDLESPGHVFVVVALDQGVVIRAGYNEAAIDICRIARLAPAAVICEMMNDDGTICRMQDLLEFANVHNLKIGTVADLIAYRFRAETLVSRIVRAPFESFYGDMFSICVYRSLADGSEHVALLKRKPRLGWKTLIYMHRLDLVADLLGSSDGVARVPESLALLGAYQGPAVALFVQDPNPASISERIDHGRRDDHVTALFRDYGIGAQILRELGVTEISPLRSGAYDPAVLQCYGFRSIDCTRSSGKAVAGEGEIKCMPGR